MLASLPGVRLCPQRFADSSLPTIYISIYPPLSLPTSLFLPLSPPLALSGHVDTSLSGKVSLLVCKSLCDDTFALKKIHPWTSADAATSDEPVCQVVAKNVGEGELCDEAHEVIEAL